MKEPVLRPALSLCSPNGIRIRVSTLRGSKEPFVWFRLVQTSSSEPNSPYVQYQPDRLFRLVRCTDAVRNLELGTLE
jgi:hypothetical protein